MYDSETGARYTLPAVVLHWLIAIAVIFMVALGWWMQSIPKLPPGPRVNAFNLHKSIGMTVLMLMVLRLAWRASHPSPPLPPMPRWQARAAWISHRLLYLCLFVMPFSGISASLFSGYPIRYFGYALPVWFARNDGVSEIFYAIHFATSCILIATVVLHIAAVIKHHREGNGVMWRMWPGAARRGTNVRLTEAEPS